MVLFCKIMESESVRTKMQRTSVQQLECYIEFVRRHPELQRAKNDPTNPKRIQDLWNEVSAELNALKGPVRTPKKWKESLSHWKNQLRSRARKAKAAKQATGGGPPEEEEVNNFEARALETFGAIVVDGLQDLPTLGTEDAVMSSGDVTGCVLENTLEDSTASEGLGESSSQTFRPVSTPRTSKKTSEEKMYNEVLEMLKIREARDAIFQQQLLDQQKMLADAVLSVLNKLTEK